MKRVTLFVALLFALSLSRPALALTALSTGYYQNTNAAIVYTGTWSTGVSSPGSYGDNQAQTSDPAATATIYTQPTVGRVGLYYSTTPIANYLGIQLNGVLVTTIPTYSVGNTFNNYYEFDVPAGTNKITLYNAPSGYLVYQGWQLLPTATVAITAVVSFPTHTPTPTLTPTLTPTTGPSPTNTPTPSPTPNYDLRVTQVIGGQSYDVAMKMEVTPADFAQVGFMVVITGLIITLIFVYVHRSQQ